MANIPLATTAALPVTGSHAGSSHRLGGVDALRGLAAVLVVLFHFTSRYDQKFGHLTEPAFSVPWGNLGVNLFFMVSGFVIFMTLDRVSRPMDFVVSRFSRLYPAYWVAAALTFLVLTVFPELGRIVSLRQALSNGLMFEGLFGVAPIDGAYWTLEVELLFYWGMFILANSVGLDRPWRWLGVWLGVSLVYGVAGRAGISFPYVVTNFLILPYFPYFALGMLLYLRFKGAPFRWQVEGALGALALLDIALIDPLLRLVFAVGFVASFYVFVFVPRVASSRTVALMARLGAISYPLYLLHENIGWTVIHHLEARGVGTNVAISLAFAMALAAATALHFAVELPAMNAIRRWYKARQLRRPASGSADAARRRWLYGALGLGLVLLIGNRIAMH
ncbi:MAG: acyltransferase [Rhizobacter sp.]